MKATLSIPQSSASQLYLVHRNSSIRAMNAWNQQLDRAIDRQIQQGKISIPTLAASLFSSERQLFRKMKQQTGKTPNEYIRDYRLQKAKKLLMSPQFKSLKEVSQQIGYKRVDYFSKLFEAYFGVRPIYLIKQH